MKMEPNTPYKIEEEQGQLTPLGPNLLQALQSDLADIMADQTKASQLLHRANDKTFDLMRKIIAIKKQTAHKA